MDRELPNDPDLSRKRKSRLLRFSIRSLLLLCALSAVMIVAMQFWWPRRTVVRFFPITQLDVQIFEPHIDGFVAKNTEIEELKIDRQTNGIIVSAQARHMEAAEKAVQRFITNPDLMFSLNANQ